MVRVQQTQNPVCIISQLGLRKVVSHAPTSQTQPVVKISRFGDNNIIDGKDSTMISNTQLSPLSNHSNHTEFILNPKNLVNPIKFNPINSRYCDNTNT